MKYSCWEGDRIVGPQLAHNGSHRMQDDAHHQEIEDITADYRNMVEEKRTMISQLQEVVQVQQLTDNAARQHATNC
jgi:hypothetical protein